METLEQKIQRVLKDEIVMCDYNPDWPRLFEKEKAHLLSCLPHNLIRRIEHFGSTAIPNLAAKPIIDMLVEVTSLDKTKQEIVPILEAQGYDYFWRPSSGDNIPPYYAWFIKRDSSGVRTHHIHMIESHFEHWDRLLFRDYLIEFPEAAAEYQKIKCQLSEKYKKDRIEYTEGKTDFIVKTTKLAKEYYCKKSCIQKTRRNIKLAITYDGHGYYGWQVQQDKPTIQGTIEAALKKLTNQDIQITGASRTDAGVSAIGQVANFKIDSPIPTDKFAIALNSILPDEIAVIKSEEAHEKFNSRFNAKSKQYQYKIFAGKVRPVLDIHHCWFYPHELDVSAMQQAAGFLVGTHDFKSFASSGDERASTIRTIFRCDVEKMNEWITITIEGDGFLYNMVRNIVGTLAEIKHRQWTPEYIKDIIQAKDRAKAGILSPAKGLCLMWVKYD